MKQTLTYLCGLATALLLVACHDDNAPATEEGTAQATFRIYTRANVSPGTDQQAALYVAERRQEDEQDELYCSARHDVGNGSYLLENLSGQWYKLAFVCVPNSVTLPDIPTDHAFNNLLLDYTPVLKQNQQEDADLAIYRHIIDRWLRPGEQLTENITLSRITGQLILDMGILKDQFPTQVTKIEIVLTDVPSQVYLRDNADGEIIYPTDKTGTYTYTYTITSEQWDSNDHFRACLNLLPHTLKEAKVTVTLVDGTDEGEEPDILTFSLVSGRHDGTGDKADINILANTRTTVYFRGMEDNEFEVRYAGFDGSGIGVDDDEWDGWR